MKRRIAIATITMARTDSETEEISSALEELAKHEWPVFVADRSTHEGFKIFLARSNFTILEGASDLVSQVRLALDNAAKSSDEILYTEPDKKFFFRERLAEFISAAKENALTLPARSPQSFATYSKIQQRVESAVNELCGAMVGVRGDFCYGPMLFPSSLAGRLDKFPAQLGWGWRLFIARAADRVALKEMDLPCPENQEADTPEEWAHRMRQFTQNIAALLHGASAEHIRRAQRLSPAMQRLNLSSAPRM